MLQTFRYDEQYWRSACLSNSVLVALTHSMQSTLWKFAFRHQEEDSSIWPTIIFIQSMFPSFAYKKNTWDNVKTLTEFQILGIYCSFLTYKIWYPLLTGNFIALTGLLLANPCCLLLISLLFSSYFKQIICLATFLWIKNNSPHSPLFLILKINSTSFSFNLLVPYPSSKNFHGNPLTGLNFSDSYVTQNEVH